MDANKSQKGLEMKYFVLKPKGCDFYAQASRQAMRAYAEIIEGVNRQLAIELRMWADKETPKSGCGCGYCNTQP